MYIGHVPIISLYGCPIKEYKRTSTVNKHQPTAYEVTKLEAKYTAVTFLDSSQQIFYTVQ
jgi:hypothetical protein